MCLMCSERVHLVWGLEGGNSGGGAVWQRSILAVLGYIKAKDAYGLKELCLHNLLEKKNLKGNGLHMGRQGQSQPDGQGKNTPENRTNGVVWAYLACSMWNESLGGA